MTEAILLDTTIREPTHTAGETEVLLFALERARAQFAWKCGGLNAADLHRSHSPSAMTIAGLLKHCIACEIRTLALHLGAEVPKSPWTEVDFDADPEWDWRTAADDSPHELYSLWNDTIERSSAAWSRTLGEGGLDQPSKQARRSGDAPNLRRVLVDQIEHYIRHTGHADLLREATDGLVGEDPPQS